MLVLSRGVGERISIGEGTWVQVLEVHGNSVRLGVVAPREVAVMREEVLRQPRRGTAKTPQGRDAG